MDEFLDQIFSSSSRPDVSTVERSSWGRNGLAQNDGLLTDCLGMFEGGERNLPVNMPPSSQCMDKLATSYDFSKDLLTDEPQFLGEVFNRDIQSLYGAELVNAGNMNSSYMSMQSNMYLSTLDSLSRSSPELVPVLWTTPSYGGVPSLPPVIEQDKLQGFGLQGDFVETDANGFGIGDDKNLNVRNFNSLTSAQEELNGLPFFVPNNQIPVARTHSQMQLPQLSEGNPTAHYTDQNPVSQLPHSSVTPGGGCNGDTKSRTRARRGHATDPHSIAERLRREKIADRMKNLQELVPNASRADKSSMLDEIIEYVKFLQLQVKVLSMSRLGAAGAVVPLITDGQPEGSGNLLLTGQEGDQSDSEDNAAFEEELVKLMESNVTAAMQFLQTKGLCLMPIALAGALSSKKEASSPDSSDKKKPYFTNGHLPHNNNPPSANSNGHNFSPNGNTMQRQNTVNNCFNKDVKQENTANARVYRID
ncbi:uncharacterized protein LOC113339289 isoform X2 [Papaver somniferum]|uniref:uncharacterized protein LOC113339289 isoform X2 n=1 Tax=Papaver somniferum TaxID=3469 RepID=UPI000E6F5493|nr:uncharacterized protein LOC113339289 isoform X2 [Papaver somniferum]